MLFLFLSAVTIAQLGQFVQAADVTQGPAAAVSIWSEEAYSTARRCAAGCLAYNGVFGCNNAGYYDLGIELGCECGPVNNCYCNTKYASSATKYVSNCVKAGCNGVEDWPDEVTSMLDLYNNYCATANVAVKTTDFTPGPTTSPSDNTADTQTTDTSKPTRATQTGSPGSGSTAPPTSIPNEEKNGLSQSDIVALAASLGVGIPSLLIAVITLVVQLRKRKRKANQQNSESPAAASNVHLIHLHTNTSTPPVQAQPHVQYDTSTYSYELDSQKRGIKY